MAHNFKIKLQRTDDNLHIHLKGDFDGSSAFELINAIKENLKNSKCLKIDTCELKEVYPFGREVFNQNLLGIKDTRIRIYFISPNALQILPPDISSM